MKKILLLIVLVVIVKVDVLAQNKQWTLLECCDYAVAHNISIKQTDNQRRKQELSLSTARNSRLPDLSASIGENSLKR